MRTLIVLLAGLFLFLPLDAQAGGRRDKLVVVDADGKRVGTVVGALVNQVTIALSVNGRHALLYVRFAIATETFPGSALFAPPIQGGGGSVFESRDCSGPPFLLQSANRLLDLGAVEAPGMTLYLPEARGALPRRIAWNSYRPYGECVRQAEPVVSDAYVPAVAAVDLLTLFTPPFRVEIVE